MMALAGLQQVESVSDIDREAFDCRSSDLDLGRIHRMAAARTDAAEGADAPEPPPNTLGSTGLIGHVTNFITRSDHDK